MVIGKISLFNEIILENILIPDDVVRFSIAVLLVLSPLLILIRYFLQKEHKCK